MPKKIADSPPPETDFVPWKWPMNPRTGEVWTKRGPVWHAPKKEELMADRKCEAVYEWSNGNKMVCEYMAGHRGPHHSWLTKLQTG